MFCFRILLMSCLILGIAAIEKDEDVGLPLSLTPYIQAGDIEEARKLSLVTGLTPNITSYSGFFTVDEECDSNMFFWFFPSQFEFESRPVTLWLQGGPGSSSLFGLFIENGPYELTLDGELKLREYTWNRETSVIYLDNPVGTGYSFAKGLECYSRNQTHMAKNALNALEQFFQLFPELLKNKFFIFGESYAGKYIPALGNAIKEGPTTIKNFEGFGIGNGLIDPINQSNYSKLYYELGLIDNKTKNEMAQIESNIQAAILKGNYTEAFILRNDKLLNETFAQRSGFKSFYNLLYSKGKKKADYGAFVDKPEIRKAIHVGNATWHDDAIDVSTLLVDDIMRSEVSDLEPIMNRYRSILYYGQLDLRDPYTPSVNFIQQLDWVGDIEYEEATRFGWNVGDELAGYGKSTTFFTELLIRNAGHMVPYDQPKWAYYMYKTFIDDQSFDNFKVKKHLSVKEKNKKLIKRLLKKKYMATKKASKKL